jgi:hypothetical protein
MSVMCHVGYAARPLKRFRWEGDPRDVKIEMSEQTARELLFRIGPNPQTLPMKELRAVLLDMELAPSPGAGRDRS